MRLELKDIEPGTILAKEIMHDNAVLVNKGQVLTAELKNRLEMFGITYVDIVSNDLDKSTETTVSNELSSRVKDALKTDDISKIKALTTDIISSIVNSLPHDDNFSNLKIDVETYNSKDPLDHPVRMAILSIALAYLYNKNVKSNVKNGNVESNLLSIYDIALAALLQDKGKNNYSPDVLRQLELMTSSDKYVAQFPELKSIPTDRYEDRYIPYYSFCLISGMPEVSRDVKMMVLYSSQKDSYLDKTIPNGDRNIYVGSQILRLCNLYDILLSHFYHTNESFENVTTYLGQAMTTGSINEDLTNLFMSEIPLYPIGTKVILSNGETAEVIKNFPGYSYSTRPVVKIISTGEKVDLRETTNLTISNLFTDDTSLDEIVEAQTQTQKTA